jgi:hypothetical protein
LGRFDALFLRGITISHMPKVCLRKLLPNKGFQ